MADKLFDEERWTKNLKNERVKWDYSLFDAV